ncbi:hypothetical protein [Nonlabens xiamenensis]|uniref:hypothetical protein n=1 Tax=Nonlabens xiamenensis TaxID=2341043 RepID=UPI000F60AC53|nr:hypothetical protein [Nonlabens xiamenensis]
MLTSKRSKLFAGLVFDAIGMASYLVPGWGELTDVAWAPIAGYLMTKLYPSKTGVAAGVFTAIEEMIPGLDIIPSFTIMWFYSYVIKSKSVDEKDKQVIDVTPE